MCVLPSAGPKNGAVAKIPVAIPRIDASNMSAIVPGLLVMHDAPNAPVKNRRTNSAGVDCAQAVPTANTVMPTEEATKMPYRPYISDSGAQRSGPTAKPST